MCMYRTNDWDKHKSIQKMNKQKTYCICYTCIGGYVGGRNELNIQKQAVVPRSLAVLSQRVGDNIS